MGRREELSESVGVDLLFMDGYDHCIIGVLERIGTEPYVLYDKDKVLESLVSDGMSMSEAIEFYEYNMLGSFVGEHTVGFVSLIE